MPRRSRPTPKPTRQHLAGRAPNPLGDRLRAAEARLEELDRIKEELELANSRLKQADRLKSEFLASVSHELRTPLTSIRSFAEILGRYDDQDPEDRRRYVSIITAETDRLSHLINDLLDLTKIEAGRADWSMRLLDVVPVLGTSLELLRPQAHERGIHLDETLPASLPAVLGDADRLKQVFTNLLSNAVKFTDRGGSVRVAAGPSPDASSLVVRVIDTGIGLAEDQIPLIFDKFVQIKHPRRASGGTGLGLPIGREIVEAHGGEIEVTSKPGHGSTFTVTLPVAVGKSHFEAYLEWRVGYSGRRGEPFTLLVVVEASPGESRTSGGGLRDRIQHMVRSSDAVLDHDRSGGVAVVAPVRPAEAAPLIGRIREQVGAGGLAAVATIAFPEGARSTEELSQAVDRMLELRET